MREHCLRTIFEEPINDTLLKTGFVEILTDPANWKQHSLLSIRAAVETAIEDDRDPKRDRHCME